ncbi:MAG: LamG domain-containing protein, partial [Bacteroidota bacterium]|nr:LamG domain-containing protein [Bacteroidota bacterium]
MIRASAIIILMLLPCALAAQYSSVNSHVTLNGSSYISIPYHFDLNEGLTSQEQMSIDAWIMPTMTGSVMTIVGNDMQSGYWFGLHTTGRLRFVPHPGASYDSKSTISTGVWTHVAVHFDEENSVVRFYINGALDQAHSLPQAWLGYAYGDLRIGADRSGSAAAYYWRGRLDEVRIWKQRIDFSSAMGDLYRIPHAVAGGLYGYALEAAWRLNGSAGDAVGSHNGSHVGSVSYAASPDASFYDRIGIRFQNAVGASNVVDHFEIPFAKGLELRNNYTIEFWVKPSSTGGHGQYQTLFCKDVSSPVAAIYPVWIGLNKSNGRLRFVPNGDMQNYLESTAALPVSQWSHVTARFQGASGNYNARLYINGLPEGEKTYTAMGPSNASRIILGASATTMQSNFVYGFNGLIDEVRIWTTSRTDLEIADNYRREFGGPASHLEAVYRFDGDVLDASGNGHHGVNSYGYAMFYFYHSTDLPSEPALTLTAPGDGTTWVIGDPVTVKWNATGLHHVTVDLSRDGGTTWSEILYNAGAATTGSVNWTVTGPESGDAHIRVRTPTATGIEDRATKITIREPVPVMQVQPPEIIMVVSRNAPLPQSIPVVVANIGGSTLSWNAVLAGGAAWLSLQPDQGTANLDTFMVQLATTDLSVGQYTERIVLEGNASNHGLQIPVTLTVTAQRVYSVSGTVRDPSGTPMEDIPMEATGERDVMAHTD